MADSVMQAAPLDRPVNATLAMAEKYGLIALLVLVSVGLVLLPDSTTVISVVGAIALLAVAGAVMLLWPLLDGTAAAATPMAPLISFVGCDGSGKSTLTGDLFAEMAGETPVELCYLGLGSGAIGERIKGWPLIGPAVERKLSKKAGQSRTKGQKIPGLPTAIVIYLFSLVRLRRFRRMLALRRAGIPVLTDRYPQTEVPGFYDGPGLSAARAGSWAIAFLAKRERALYSWMASFQPDVVIRLNVDLETAFARKPDHRYDLLREKVRVTPLLRFNGAPIVDLDACAPYEAVRSAASRTVHDVLDAPARPATR